MSRIPIDAPIVIEDAPAPPAKNLLIPGLLRLDLSTRRRVFVCGDIHGCFALLDARLAELSFDWTQDALISLGDLIDRGPDSIGALAFLQRPSVWAVRGNHEQMLLDAWANPESDAAARDLVTNGGDWFYNLPETAGPDSISQNGIGNAFAALPLAIEAKTPGGRTIGIVHAGVPGDNWRHIRELPAAVAFDPAVHWDNRTEPQAMAEHMVWDRRSIQDALRFAHLGHEPAEFPPVAGIDHVFHGHNIVRRPVRLGNTTWLDTGAFQSGIITVIDADAWIDSNTF